MENETFRIKPKTKYLVHDTREPEDKLQTALADTGRTFDSADIITRTARHLVVFCGSYVHYIRHEDVEE